MEGMSVGKDRKARGGALFIVQCSMFNVHFDRPDMTNG
jgi:hypothetical protein